MRAAKTRFIVALLVFSAACLGWGCSDIAERTAPEKRPITSRSNAALKADAPFWLTFHAGGYEEIPAALQALRGLSGGPE